MCSSGIGRHEEFQEKTVPFYLYPLETGGSIFLRRLQGYAWTFDFSGTPDVSPIA